jgi:hypothetical protein
MTRSFGSHAKSEFDRTLSCGFDMPSDSVRRMAVQNAARRANAQPSHGPAARTWLELGQAGSENAFVQMRTTKKLTRASTNPSGSRKLEFDGSRGRSVTDDGILELATVLNEPQTNIEGLSLRYMRLSDEACSALADAIAVNWTLGRFELHGTVVCRPYQPVLRLIIAVAAPGNQMSAASCEKLADALKRHPKLAILEAGCAFPIFPLWSSLHLCAVPVGCFPSTCSRRERCLRVFRTSEPPQRDPCARAQCRITCIARHSSGHSRRRRACA